MRSLSFFSTPTPVSIEYAVDDFYHFFVLIIEEEEKEENPHRLIGVGFRAFIGV